MRSKPLALLALSLASCATTVTRLTLPLDSAEALEIGRLEATRSAGGRLAELTHAAAPAVQSRALLALARLQTPDLVAVAAPALDDPSVEVRAMAAFALGQVGMRWDPAPETVREAAEKRLLARLLVEPIGDVQGAIFEALGKVGGQPGMEALIRGLGAEAAPAAASALGVMAKRTGGKLKSSDAVSGLSRLSRDDSPQTRFAAVYALMRYEELAARPALLKGLSDPAPEVRATCARGVAALRQEEDVIVLASALDDADERVAAEAARGLARQAVACAAPASCPALLALEASKAPWRPAVASAVAGEPVAFALGYPFLASHLHALDNAISAASDPLAKRTFARSHCEAALAHDRALGRLEALTTCGAELVSLRDRLRRQARALAESKLSTSERFAALQPLLTGADPVARAAGAEILGAIDLPEARQALRTLLADADPRVARAAAGAVDEGKVAEMGTELASLLERSGEQGWAEAAEAALDAATTLKAQATLPSARRVLVSAEAPADLRRAAARAVHALTGETVTAPEPAPWEDTHLYGRVVVLLQTERGPVRLLLYPEEAPTAARSFVHLVRRGFFRGLSFHRVVPGFVAQGGDPRGDGSGGPGYTLRCEVNPRRYQAGSLGMALSGADTGGSQFFVTLTPQPHLDGRYTLFGEVVEGMESVRAVVEGDRILQATVEAEAPARLQQ